MIFYPAIKVVIITEKVIQKDLCRHIEELGASGYTMTEAAGKGSRNIRANRSSATLVEDFNNLKIEVLLFDEQIAYKLMKKVTQEYFGDYSGIIYREDVQVMRPEKFISTHVSKKD